MVDILSGGVLGSFLGGMFRLTPEILKWLDKKNERAHELAMFEKQVDLEKVKGEIKLREVGAQHDMAVDVGVLEAFKAAVAQQAELAKSAGGWVASLSASVRPLVTYWVLFVWTFVHVWFAFTGLMNGASPDVVFKTIMTADFAALVAGTINYWFLDRTLAKRGLS